MERKNNMKYLFAFFMLIVCVFANAQNIEKKCDTCKKIIKDCKYKGRHPNCKTCGKTVDFCNFGGKHPKCATCGKVVEQCKYSGKHPKCAICGELLEQCAYNENHSLCKICKKYDFQCQYKCNHPLCEDCELVIDSCEFNGQHTKLSLYELAVSYEKKENYEKSVKLCKKASSLNVIAAKLLLAYYYKKGKGVDINPDEANKLLEEVRKEAENGNYDAIHNLGIFYFAKFGKLEDAEVWFRKGAEMGHAEDQYLLSVMLITQKKIYDAIPWLKKASEQGHSEAMDALGQLYQQGVGGTAKDAFTLFYKCAEEGNKAGQYRLAYCYDKGIGTAQNIEIAKIWYKKAADQGDEKSVQRLQELSK